MLSPECWIVRRQTSSHDFKFQQACVKLVHSPKAIQERQKKAEIDKFFHHEILKEGENLVFKNVVSFMNKIGTNEL